MWIAHIGLAPKAGQDRSFAVLTREGEGEEEEEEGKEKTVDWPTQAQTALSDALTGGKRLSDSFFFFFPSVSFLLLLLFFLPACLLEFSPSLRFFLFFFFFFWGVLFSSWNKKVDDTQH